MRATKSGDADGAHDPPGPRPARARARGSGVCFARDAATSPSTRATIDGTTNGRTGRARRSRRPAPRSPCRCSAAGAGSRRSASRPGRAVTAAAAVAAAAAAAASGVDTAGHGTDRTQARPRPWRSRWPAVPSGQRLADRHEHLDDELRRRRCRSTSRASPLASMVTHEPGSSRLSGRCRARRARTAPRRRARRRRRRRPSPSISFHGKRAGVGVDAPGAPAVAARRRGRAGTGATGAAERRVVDGPPRRLAEHPVGLVDRGHRLGVGRRRGRGGGAGRGDGRRRGSRRPWRRGARRACRSGCDGRRHGTVPPMRQYSPPARSSRSSSTR